MNRTINAVRNVKYGYVAMAIQIILGFISRTIFIYTLGLTYLGVNGLYANILGVLSLAELGIGTAVNFSLYKPISMNDLEKIKSLMQLYKRAYRWIALAISGLGLLLIPFLNYIIKDPGNISASELKIFYLIFLFNTVTTYFIAYKYSITNAEQKNYIQTNIQAITTLIIVLAQILVLLLLKDFLIYLLIGAILGLIQKIAVNIYFNKKYPYLLEKDVLKLTKEEKDPIKKNIIALMYHKIGEISIYQTDNIIISSFINVTTVGLISNYNLLITSVSGFISIIFNSLISGIGNLIVTESNEKQYEVFKIYRFVAFWMYGFSSIAFLTLLSPFIILWIGKEMLISDGVIYLIITNYYFLGHRIVINNFKIAAGIFVADKYVAIIQAILNLVISIILVQFIGLAGVFIGTICAGLVSTFIKPRIVYKMIFKVSVWEYYRDSLLYLIAICITLLILELIQHSLFFNTSILSFFELMVLVAFIPNVIFYLLLKNREEFKYISKFLSLKLRRS